MKFAKYFDQHRALTTRDDAFFTFFLTSVYIYNRAVKNHVRISLSEIFRSRHPEAFCK